MRKVERLERAIAAMQEDYTANGELERRPEDYRLQLLKCGAWNARSVALSRLTEQDMSEIRDYAWQMRQHNTEYANITMEVFPEEEV